MMEQPKITVIGSLNMDLVTITEQLPERGETLIGQHFQMNPGGKGANQAVAAARLGACTTMIGCVGNDPFGKQLIENLAENGVHIDNVESIPHSTTGTATILVSEEDNRIIVTPGANHEVTVDFIESKRDIIAKSDVVVLQLEIPLESVIRAVEIAKANGVKVILNPAPICDLPHSLLKQVDYITPNEHEKKVLIQNEEEEQALQEKLIVTLGEHGVAFYEDGQLVNIPANKVQVVDTTGAGDSFNGALAVALSEGKSLREACLYSSAVAALSITKLGAQTGMPTAEEVNEFLKK